MPYSRHVGYLCPGITLSRRVITGRHAALRFTRPSPSLSLARTAVSLRLPLARSLCFSLAPASFAPTLVTSLTDVRQCVLQKSSRHIEFDESILGIARLTRCSIAYASTAARVRDCYWLTALYRGFLGHRGDCSNEIIRLFCNVIGGAVGIAFLDFAIANMCFSQILL